ncbi:MAG: hypothetical protein QOJ40_1935 [Verrucomicrobiota bacterium]
MNRQYRATAAAYLVIAGLPTSILGLALWGNSGVNPDKTILVILIAVSGSTFAWVAGYQIIITPTLVVFRTLFGRRSISVGEIGKIHLVWLSPFGRQIRDAIKAPLRLVIEPNAFSSTRPLDINAKVFPRDAINAIRTLDPGLSRSAQQ